MGPMSEDFFFFFVKNLAMEVGGGGTFLYTLTCEYPPPKLILEKLERLG